MVTRYGSSFDKTIPFTEVSYPFQLTGSTVTTITLPGNNKHKYVLTFGNTTISNIFVGYNETPVVPAANTATLTSKVEFVVPGSQRFAIGGDVISLITPDPDAYGSVSVRSIPN